MTIRIDDLHDSYARPISGMVDPAGDQATELDAAVLAAIVAYFAREAVFTHRHRCGLASRRGDRRNPFRFRRLQPGDFA